jgi:hypothetical protein
MRSTTLRPDDANGHLPTDQRPFRVLVLAGSDRRQYNCPGVDSKARALMLRMTSRLPEAWEIDFEDLGNVYGRARIQSCNACVSTSMALCVWPCNCYEKGSRKEPDLMWDADLYARLDLADAWAVIGPVNWYAPSSNLKLLFDRLVCASGGNPREELIRHKDPELARALEHRGEWRALSRNHLEGRTAAFFCYSDGGADEEDATGRPRKLRHRDYFDPSAAPFADGRDAYAPLVWQCRYSGIEVPDRLWRHVEHGKGKPYSEDQAEHMLGSPAVLGRFDAWTDDFAAYVAAKGKVPPGEFRAFGYTPPGHRLADLRLKLREWRLAAHLAPPGSSPAAQDRVGLNRDATFRPKKTEGERLREP